MVLSLAVAVVLSQSAVKKVEIIRGTSAKKAPKTTESLLSPAPAGPTAEQAAREKALDAKASELDARNADLTQRAGELKTKEAAGEAQKEADAKNQAAQQKIVEKHGRDLQREYEKAANALAGEQ